MGSANVLFYFLLILGPIVSISSSNWVLCWTGIELSFMGMIPLLFTSGVLITLSKESSLKYFCVQAFGSSLLFISGLVLYSMLMPLLSLKVLFFLGLCIKLGVFPGHFWVPSVICGLDWLPSFLLLTVQKIAPVALLSNFLAEHTSLQEVSLLLGGISALVGGMIGNNFTSIRGVIGASSIAHTGWVVIGVVCGYFWLYFFLYCFTLSLSLLSFHQTSNLASSFSILSLSGLPPFLMFMGKWSILKASLDSSIFIGFLILPIVGTFLSLIFYLKFAYSFYLNSDITNLKKESPILSLLVVNILGMVYLVSI